MKSCILYINLFLVLIFSGCSSLATKAEKVQGKINDKISQGVYATNDSMNVGRFDLAKKYSDQTVRLVPSPKDRINIEAFYAPK